MQVDHLSKPEIDLLIREASRTMPAGDLLKQIEVRKILSALVEVESGGDPWAARYEPDYKWTALEVERPLQCTMDTEEAFQKTSWGLTQIMGAVARECGFRGWLSQLTDPETNIRWACIHLCRLGERMHWNEADLVSSWNQGSQRRTPDGEYKNQHYVNCVVALMRKQSEYTEEEMTG
jgi:hypothetical protein